jgi:hypothetical protein
MPEAFGCCSSYQECSDTGKCIHGNDEYSGCQYRKNLEAGRNFYRQYTICVKSNSWWSYPAKPERAARVYALLQQAGILQPPVHKSGCTSRVLIELDDKVYAIYSPGTRLMPKAAASDMAIKLKQYVPAKVDVLSGNHQQVGAISSPIMAPEKPKIPEPVKKIKYEQISIFDLMGG